MSGRLVYVQVKQCHPDGGGSAGRPWGQTVCHHDTELTWTGTAGGSAGSAATPPDHLADEAAAISGAVERITHERMSAMKIVSNPIWKQLREQKDQSICAVHFLRVKRELRRTGRDSDPEFSMFMEDAADIRIACLGCGKEESVDPDGDYGSCEACRVRRADPIITGPAIAVRSTFDL